MRIDLIKQIVVWHLKTHHTGKDNGVTVEKLSVAINVSPRDIRQAVSDLREEGLGISATPKSGYYIAQKADEIEECCQNLHKRAMSSLRSEARLRKMALPELLGQISLDIAEPPTSVPCNPITQFINQSNQGASHHD